MYSSPKLRIVLMFAATLLLCANISAQTYWINHAGGPTIDEALDIAVDPNGNSYVTGYFTTLASFGSVNVNSAGLDDIFIAKTDNTGLYQWVIRAGGTGSDRALSIATDASGNSYVTGYYFGSATFGSQTITSSGAQDIFIAKYDNAGIFQWVQSAGGAGADIGNGIAVDNTGNVFVTGEFAGTATFGSASLSSMNGSVDVFTTKLSPAGTFQWSKKGSAHLTDRGIDVACDASGNCYITGQFSDTITFDQVHQNNMLNAVFIVKYDASGNEVWYRKIGGGAVNISTSICSDGTAIYIAGDFQGTITFFGSVNTNLTATYFNGIFIAKYDLSGNLTWDVSESSDSPLTGRAVAVNGSNLFLAGNFKCTFDSYSDRYDPYHFNSSGYWDIFIGKYNSASGAFNISRQMGGPKDQFCNGVGGDAAGNPHVAGSYNQDLTTPASGSFYGAPAYTQYDLVTNSNVCAIPNNCSDPDYANYAVALTAGSSDIYVMNPLDPNRSLYDYYYHTSCGVGYEKVCINQYNGYDYDCGPDTIDGCNQTNLYAATNTGVFAVSPQFLHIGPDYNFLWSTGATSQVITVPSTGDYTVTMTSADGCYTTMDTIHFIMHNPPPIPCVSDNVVINTNSTNPSDIVICADSVLLVGGCFGPGLTIDWSGPQFTPDLLNDSAWIDSSGFYYFTVTDIYGCSRTVTVEVVLDDPLMMIDPAMICLNDTDMNDTVTICDNTPLFFYPYDSLNNPNAFFQCIEDDSVYLWTISPNASATILPYTDCANFLWAQTTAMVHDTGWYTITATLIRTSACGNDTIVFSDSIYVEVIPAPPPIPYNLQIQGDTVLCPGDSLMLVVTGGFNDYLWNTQETNDTIYVVQGGLYIVSCVDTTYNSYGCFTVSSDIEMITIAMTPQPIITLFPSNGVICPGDSVLAVVSGVGNYVWSGPNGPIPINNDSTWITSPGLYNCVVTSPDSCQLLSNTVTIQQYNTPQLVASPAAVICPGDSVTLSLVASNGSFVAWLPPLSGSALTQVVTSPGTYGVSVSACSIITTTSITIVQTNVTALITPLSGLTVCEGDSILLGANPGMDSYNWTPGNMTDSIVYVYTSGNYILTTADTGGCEAHDTIPITFMQNNLSPPTTADTIVCIGMPFHLFANGAPTITWYDWQNNVLSTGNNLYFPTGILQDSTFYVLTDDGICRSTPSAVNVQIQECPPLTPNVFTPNADGSNDVFQLYEPEATGIHVWIYDRWGVLIYEYTEVYGYWDGTYMLNGRMCVDGVYYWIAEMDYSGVPGKKSGFVHLLNHGY